MKIVREIPKEYSAIRFDVKFVKRYGLIKYPMVKRRDESVFDRFDFKTVKRTDFFGKLFGLHETIKTPKFAPKQQYRLEYYETEYHYPEISKALYYKDVHDGDWIVTDREGHSMIYTPDEFHHLFDKVSEGKHGR